MARLTRMQLRAIFARLREKGLLRYAKKGKSVASPAVPGEGEKTTFVPRIPRKELDQVFSKKIAQHYIERLPKHLQVKIKGIRIYDRELVPTNHSRGMYDFRNNIIHITRRLAPEDVYATGTYIGKYGGTTWYDFGRGITTSYRGVLTKRALKRRGKLVTARIFYHEYGHAVWRGLPKEVRHRFEAKRGEWGALSPNPFYDEGFADLFSMYATTKSGRHSLKKTLPDGYDLIKAVFEGDA